MPFATFLVALLAGMGVGSGGLYVVYLTLFAGRDQLSAQGLNLYFFIFAAAAALLLHTRTAPVRWRRLAVLCAVGAVGCAFGVWSVCADRGDGNRHLNDRLGRGFFLQKRTGREKIRKTSLQMIAAVL